MIRMADAAMMQSADTITLAEAYDAMRIFLESVWHRLGTPQVQIVPACRLEMGRWDSGRSGDVAGLASGGVDGEGIDSQKNHSSYPARSASRLIAASRWALPNCKRIRVSVRPSLVIP